LRGEVQFRQRPVGGGVGGEQLRVEQRREGGGADARGGAAEEVPAGEGEGAFAWEVHGAAWGWDQSSTASPGTASRSESFETTVALPRVSATAASWMSIDLLHGRAR